MHTMLLRVGVAVTLMEVVEQFKTVLPVLFVIAAVGGVVF